MKNQTGRADCPSNRVSGMTGTRTMDGSTPERASKIGARLMATMSQEEVFKKVQDVLVDALGVDAEDITPQAKLVADLGAESIDFLDIVFRLEKTFGIKVQQSELFPDNVLSDPQYVQGGKVTDLGMAELRKRMPHSNLDEFDKNRSVQEFSNVFTVETIVKFVQAKIG
jgi:acyl carrier protein